MTQLQETALPNDLPESRVLLRVLAAGAAKAVVSTLAPLHQARFGQILDITFDTVGALRDRALRGEPADILILSDTAMQAVDEALPGTLRMTRELGRTGIGLAGTAGREPADIATPESFCDLLLGARSIGYADPARGATAGTRFAHALEQLGLTERLRDRLRVFAFGVDAVSAVSRGEVEVAVSQATEIVPRPEVSFLGLFPEPYQLWTRYQAAALSDREEANAFLDLLGDSEGTAALRHSGFVHSEATGRH
jgi:molybdate transport system substrate-binding protein